MNDQDLVTFVKKSQRDSYAARKDPEHQWQVNIAMLDGDHWIKASRESRTVRRLADPKPGEVRAIIMEVHNRYLRALSRWIQSPPKIKVSPRNLAPGPIFASRMQEAVLKSLIEQDSINFPREYCAFIRFLHVCGTAAFQISWDPNAEAGRGQIRIGAVPAWELYPVPGGVLQDNDMTGIIRSRVMPKSWVQAVFPELADKLEKGEGGSPSVSGSGESHHPLLKKGVWVHWFYSLPNPDFPQGEEAIVVHEQLAARAGQLDYWKSPHERALPIVTGRFAPSLNNWFGMSYVWPITQLNRELNRQLSLEIRARIQEKNFTLAPEGSIVMNDLKGNDPSPVVQYRSHNIFGSTQPFHTVSSARQSPRGQLLMGTVTDMIRRMANQPELTEGDAPGRVDSFAGLQLLKRETGAPSSQPAREVSDVLTGLSRMVLQMAARKWDPKDERIMSYLGTFNLPLTMSVTPQLLASQETQVLPGSITTDATEDTVQDLIGMLNTQAIDPIEFRRGLAAINYNLPGVDLITNSEILAMSECQVLAGDWKLPGQLPEPMPQFVDVPRVIRVFKDFVSDPMFNLAAAPEVKAAFVQRMTEYAIEMSGDPAGPDIDEIAEMSDAEALGEELAAEA